ncbi:hypothetical protein ACOSP7_018486 [Xanthoceras sorbifolium]
MLAAKPFHSHMVTSAGHYLSAYVGSPISNVTEYRSIVGALQYATVTRPDEFCIFLGPKLVIWSVNKQHTISRSSTEAEYRILASIVAEHTWLTSLLRELDISQYKVPTVWCDNQITIAMSHNPILHTRTKHIELDMYFVRDKVVSKQLLLNNVHSVDQFADIFTKALPTPMFHFLRGKLTVLPAPVCLREDVSDINDQGLPSVTFSRIAGVQASLAFCQTDRVQHIQADGHDDVYHDDYG